MILFPMDTITKNVDPRFSREFDWMAEEGFTCGLYDTIHKTVDTSVRGEHVLYRGWMLTADEYCALDAWVERHGGLLIVSPGRLVNVIDPFLWLDLVQSLRPDTRIFSPSAFDLLQRFLEDFLEKHTVAVMKAGRKSPLFASNVVVKNDNIERAIQRVLEDPNSDGNYFMMSAHEDYDTEARLWVVSGEVRMVAKHPTQGTTNALPDEKTIQRVQQFVERLNNPFFTVDMALRSDGVWRVVEIDDAQSCEVPEDRYDDFVNIVGEVV